MNKDVLVIGGGMSGLTTAWQLASAGLGVHVAAKGWGATHWHAGCIDVLQAEGPLDEALDILIDQRPTHPYAIAGRSVLTDAIDDIKALFTGAGYPLEGSLSDNWLLPTAAGVGRQTCLAPATMTGGDLRRSDPLLIVGIRQHPDFFAPLVADNLRQTGHSVTAVTVDLPSLASRRSVTPVILATALDDPAVQFELAAQVRPHLGASRRVGLPAVLGLRNTMAAVAELEKQFKRPVFEIPGLPPSVPGIRLHNVLIDAIKTAGGFVFDGMEAVGFDATGRTITAVYTEAAGRPRAHRFNRYVLATGGILGGGIETRHDGTVREVVFDLPIAAPAGHTGWFQREFLHRNTHPIYEAGVIVNQALQPVQADRPVFDNLYAVGTTLAHFDAIRERSLEGVAVATGFSAAQQIIRANAGMFEKQKSV